MPRNEDVHAVCSDVKRKIAAIMAADVVGYSRMISEDEEETLRRLISYREVFADFVGRADGRIFNTAGDAVLAEFPSAVDALRAAIEIQESIRTRNLAYPESRHMRFRIGMTIGDVVERDGDLLGDGVNVAARLEGLAEPGGICISRSVHEQVSSKLSISFRDIGLQRVKNIPTEIHAYQVPPFSPEPSSPPKVVEVPPVPRRSRTAALAIGGMLGIVVALGLALVVYRLSGRSEEAAATLVGPPAMIEASRSDLSAPPAHAPVARIPPSDDAPDVPRASPHGEAALPPEAVAPEPGYAPLPPVAPPASEASVPVARSTIEGAPLAETNDDAVSIADPILLDEVKDLLFEQDFDPGDPGSPAMAAAIKAFEEKAGLPVSDKPTGLLLRSLREARSLKPWGAIAFAKGANSWGMAWGSPTRRIAIAVAHARCGSGSCSDQVSFYGHNCGAFALSNRSWSMTWRDSEGQARQAALDGCGQGGTACRMIGAVCADGSGHSKQSAYGGDH